jgi:hypothetical protein
MNSEPLPLGTVVKPYGKIGAVMFTGGERYYMLTSKDGDVAMMPWFVIEPEQASEGK